MEKSPLMSVRDSGKNVPENGECKQRLGKEDPQSLEQSLEQVLHCQHCCKLITHLVFNRE